jgi:hypothetical protein
MPDPSSAQPTPPDCFQQTEAETLLRAEGRQANALRYYLWHRSAAEIGFLYALEIGFVEGESLWVAYDEEAHGLRIVDASRLAHVAQSLQALHGEAIIKRLDAHLQPLWAGTVGATLLHVLLSPREDGLYANDALMLDFGQKRVLLAVGQAGEPGIQLLEQ